MLLMTRKVKYVDLVFENCESVRLSPDMFKGLGLGGVKKDYCVNCYQYTAGEVCEHVVCESFRIVINGKGLDGAALSDKPLPGGPRTLRERLRHCDITHVDLIYSVSADDGGKDDHEYIAVPWYWPGEGESERYDSTNYHQVHTWGENLTGRFSGEEVAIEIRAGVVTDGKGNLEGCVPPKPKGGKRDG